MEGLSRDALVHVAGRFKLLANPARLAILQHICEREKTVTELVEATGFKQANVSKQLGLLDRGGLVRRRTEGNHVYYAVADPMLPELCRIVKDGLLSREDAVRASLGTPPPGHE